MGETMGRVKSQQVKGHVDPKVRDHPSCKRRDLRRLVRQLAHHQEAHLNPHTLVLEELQRAKHRIQTCLRHSLIASIIKSLDVELDGINQSRELTQRSWVHVTSGDEHILDPCLLGKLRCVTHVLEPHHRLGVRVRNRRSPTVQGALHQLSRCHAEALNVFGHRLGYLPVLAVGAS
jgi:hypothetical protein